MLRKIIFFVVIGLVAIIGIFIAVHYLTTGKVTITSGKGEVDIMMVDESGKEFTSRHTNKSSWRVKPGKYSFFVSSGSQASSLSIDLKAREHIKHTINLKPVMATEVVAPVNALSYYLTPNSLIYLNPNTGSLQKIDSQSLQPERFINEISGIKEVEWDNGMALVSAEEDGSILAKVSPDGSISPIDISSITRFSDSIGAISVANGRFAVASGRNVFLSESTTAVNKKPIYKGRSTPSGLFLGSSHILIKNSGESAEVEQSEEIKSVIVNLKSGEERELSENMDEASWNNSGSMFAYINSRGGEVLNTNLDRKGLLPDLISDLIWLDETTLIYSRKNEIWKLNTQIGLSEKIASMPAGGIADYLYLNEDKSAIYQNSKVNGSYSITKVRIGEEKYTVDENIIKVQKVTPYENSRFKIEYYNISNPALLITTYGILNRPSQFEQYRQQNDQYAKEALELLKEREIDPDKFTIRTLP